jgi:hypothetical protein
LLIFNAPAKIGATSIKPRRPARRSNQLAELETASSKTRFVCNLGVMNPDQRARYIVLSRKLRDAHEERRELEHGYAFRLAAQQISLLEIAEWITFERQCCPFFNLQIVAEENGGPLWVRMTGAPGVKQFILSEIGE